MNFHYKDYKADKITVKYSPKLCIHAAECVKGLPQVFDPDKKPWIQPEKATPEELMTVIKKCPTGALQYEVDDKSKLEKYDYDPQIEMVKDGPLYFKGEIELEDMAGNKIAHEGRMALCRCGASKNKPFCDNSHEEINFNG